MVFPYFTARDQVRQLLRILLNKRINSEESIFFIHLDLSMQ